MRTELWLLLVPFVCSSKLTPAENDRRQKICGATFLKKSMALSFGGRPAKEGEYPWAVLVEQNDVCSGTLISQRHVLSAAHCFTSDNRGPEEKCNGYKIKRIPVPKDPFRIWLGTECAKHLKKCEAPYSRTSAAIYLRQDGCQESHDVAIVELNEPVPESMATPICIPYKSTPIPKTLKFIGNGVISPIQLQLGGHQVVDMQLEAVLSEKYQIKTRSPNGTGLCGGDSGGTLFKTDKQGINTIVGTYWYGETCYINFPQDYPEKREHMKHNGPFDFFSDITKYEDWICGVSGVCNSHAIKKKKRTISM